jgi:hypothetical protein
MTYKIKRQLRENGTNGYRSMKQTEFLMENAHGKNEI